MTKSTQSQRGGAKVSRFTTKQELLDDILKERRKLEKLLGDIPDSQKTIEVIDGMSVKDFLAHRTEWGRMMIRWYTEAKAGIKSAVPSDKYKWNQLNALNAEIYAQFKDRPLSEITEQYNKVHDELYQLIETTTEEELFTKKFYDFTGTSVLAAYFNSSTAAHYRSAAKHIRKWWKAQQ
ncbi:MAG: ClbS/DfsB family four-helix bundle protein [Leptolyngbya sp. SIO1E4]|nr:ClbS/DfsB family four-helix bundle protein [Leptolyngbya sp. SIO1E4]